MWVPRADVGVRMLCAVHSRRARAFPPGAPVTVTSAPSSSGSRPRLPSLYLSASALAEASRPSCYNDLPG